MIMKRQLSLITLTTFALGVLGAGPSFGAGVLNDDYIVEGHLCVSQDNDCTPTESYPSGLSGNATIKAKAGFPSIYIEDNDSGASDWSFFVDWNVPTGVFPRSSLAIGNVVTPTDTAYHWPVVIEDGGPNFQLYLDANGRVGIRTKTPSEELEIFGSSPTIALADSAGTTWELNSNPNSYIFDIANVTDGRVPFSMRKGSPTNSLTINDKGEVGLGIASAARQLHLRGGNAVFRMDRSTDTAAFLMVRTDGGFNPLKTFVVGTNASGVNNGEFIINDLGTQVAGGGARRMTIDTVGNVIFNGNTYAPGFFTFSSRELKDNIETIADPLETVSKLRGVRFDWKESGESALGFIAEEVAEVLPEVVMNNDEDGKTASMSYAALVPVLVEAVKAQQAELESLRLQVSSLESVEARLMKIEAMLGQEATDQLVVSR